ncbi:hypothetical protein SAMN06314042_10233 [Epsilonproteobacteria bacterium SCGC AD-308-O04]|nr:hypothetical protein SAMN06314042_10233 [Epsilonproteobacteria bacterium SCGC AD-308-O04]
MLIEIMSQLGHTYSDDDHIEIIEDLYEDIYDEITEDDSDDVDDVDDTDDTDDVVDTIFEEDCSFEVKELIVQYLNHENFQGMSQDTIEKINKSIINALEILEKYKTPEYQCLVDNGFCNPDSERPPYEGYIDKEWHAEYQQQFIDKAQELGIEEPLAQKMISGLESII